jgi:hypothetical protein
MKLTINFGSLAPRIKYQLAAAKVRAHYKDVATWQADADAITRLLVRGLLTGPETVKCRRKLMKDIISGVVEA